MKSLDKQSFALEALRDLQDCHTELAAREATKKVVEALGANYFVYTTVLPPESPKAEESLRFFIGCKDEMCQIYSANKWMMNDPFFAYARVNTGPILASRVKIATPGQSEIVKTSAEHGFLSGLIVPTHTAQGASKRFGVLYIGSELPAEAGEPALWSERMMYSMLGQTVLQWWSDRLREQAMRRYSLFNEDVELLQLAQQNLTANEIAAQLDLTPRAIYKRLSLLKEKFDVERIELAIAEAESVGLF